MRYDDAKALAMRIEKAIAALIRVAPADAPSQHKKDRALLMLRDAQLAAWGEVCHRRPRKHSTARYHEGRPPARPTIVASLPIPHEITCCCGQCLGPASRPPEKM